MLHAGTAPGTLFRIHDGVEIFHPNGLFRTGLYAFHTADTGHLAGFSGFGALIAVGAEDDGLLFHRENVDQFLGASGHAFSTGTAQGGIYHRNSVANGNGAKFTHGLAIAKTEATVLALFGASVQ